MNTLQSIQMRIQRLGLSPAELGIEDLLTVYTMNLELGQIDYELQAIIESALEQAEATQQMGGPFTDPMSPELMQGEIVLLRTHSEQEVRISVNGGSCPFTHLFVSGKSGSGKSCLAASIAAGAASAGYATLLIDSSSTFSAMEPLCRTHRYGCVDHLRLNPWDDVPGVSHQVVDQVVNGELCASYGLKFAEYEIGETVAEIRREGMTPNLFTVIERLRKRSFSGMSKRRQYCDSALLVLTNLLGASGELFHCAKGMSLGNLLNENLVLDMSGLLPEHQAFVTRLLVERVHLLSRSRERLSRRLLMVLDEGQVLAKQQDFPQKMLQLRHRGIHLVLNMQNISAAPAEMLGNCDAFVSFQSIDARDRDIITRVMNLPREQSQAIAFLETGQAVGFLPRSPWKRAFLGSVPRVSQVSRSFGELDNLSSAFFSSYTWNPYQENKPSSPPEKKEEEKECAKPSGLEEREEALLRDILNQRHEFSALTERFERAGIRSASLQARDIKSLLAKGYIQLFDLAVGRGRPIKLAEPTEKALREFGVTWKKSRGTLTTRAATEFLFRKLKGESGWQCIPEGDLAGKQVDLLCRSGRGDAVAVEIAGSAAHEVHNALHCLQQVEVKAHAIVCVSKDVLTELKKKLNKFPELKTDSRLEVLLLTKALSNKWIPFNNVETNDLPFGKEI